MERAGIDDGVARKQDGKFAWAQRFTTIVSFAPAQLQFGDGQC
jgi:hypothetical protein